MVAYGAFDTQGKNHRMRPGRILHHLSAGLSQHLPRLIAVCLLISTGLNAFRIFKRRDDTSVHQQETPVGSSSAVIGIAIVILLYPLLLYTLKAILATFVSSFAMLWLMRYKSILKCLVISLAVSASVYVIFGLMLGVTLPSGPIEQLMWRLH
jgi:hypothetical protein